MTDTPRPNIPRLLRLIEVLEQVEREKRPFYLGLWVDSWICGTVACACGYAALDPGLAAQGLQLLANLKNDDGYIIEHHNMSAVPIPEGYHVDDGWIEFEDHMGMDAAAEFFGIDYDTAVNIFDINGYDGPTEDITPSDVVSKIRTLIAERAP